MLAGAMAKGGDPAIEYVSAYVVLSEGVKSRVFKLGGAKSSPEIEELKAATTIDLKRFRDAVLKDLEGRGAITPADPNWACDVVRVHVRADLGV
jgi:hypothetical protein